MNKLCTGIFLTVCISGMSSGVEASTVGRKEIECSYTNATAPERNISGTCQVDYGVTGVSGQGFRRIIWPDGVVTQVSITAGGNTQAEVDGFPSQVSLSCGHEIYRIGNNALELRGDLCR